MKIRDLMTKDVHCCSVHDNLERPAQLMWDHDTGCVPVIDDQQRVAGMVTDRDVCMAAYMTGQPLRAIPVRTAMSHQVVVCHPDDDVRDVERLLQQHQLHRLPVVEDSAQIAGIVSLCDLARHTARQRGEPAHTIAAREVADTLAAISQPR